MEFRICSGVSACAAAEAISARADAEAAARLNAEPQAAAHCRAAADPRHEPLQAPAHVLRLVEQELAAWVLLDEAGARQHEREIDSLRSQLRDAQAKLRDGVRPGGGRGTAAKRSGA